MPGLLLELVRSSEEDAEQKALAVLGKSEAGDLKELDDQGRTIIHLCVLHRKPKLLEGVLQYTDGKSLVDVQAGEHGQSALQMLLESPETDTTEVVKELAGILVRARASLTQVDCRGKTAMDLAKSNFRLYSVIMQYRVGLINNSQTTMPTTSELAAVCEKYSGKQLFGGPALASETKAPAWLQKPFDAASITATAPRSERALSLTGATAPGSTYNPTETTAAAAASMPSAVSSSTAAPDVASALADAVAAKPDGGNTMESDSPPQVVTHDSQRSRQLQGKEGQERREAARMKVVSRLRECDEARWARRDMRDKWRQEDKELQQQILAAITEGKQLHGQVVAKINEANAKFAALDAERMRARELEANLAQRERDIQFKEKAQQEKEDELKNREQALTEQLDRLNSQKKELKGMEEQLHIKQEKLQARERDMSEQDASCESRRREIAAMKDELDKQSASLRDFHAELSCHEQAIRRFAADSNPSHVLGLSLTKTVVNLSGSLTPVPTDPVPLMSVDSANRIASAAVASSATGCLALRDSNDTCTWERNPVDVADLSDDD